MLKKIHSLCKKITAWLKQNWKVGVIYMIFAISFSHQGQQQIAAGHIYYDSMPFSIMIFSFEIKCTPQLYSKCISIASKLSNFHCISKLWFIQLNIAAIIHFNLLFEMKCIMMLLQMARQHQRGIPFHFVISVWAKCWLNFE